MILISKENHINGHHVNIRLFLTRNCTVKGVKVPLWMVSASQLLHWSYTH